MTIDVQNAQRYLPINRRRVRQLAQKVLAHFKCHEGLRVNFLFLDDKKMARLNKAFLGKEGSTDVLAFGMREGKKLSGDPALLGDIAISTETALRHAKRYRSNVEREVDLYVIHGLLHLLGYDDRSKSVRLKMRQKEKELLQICQNGA